MTSKIPSQEIATKRVQMRIEGVFYLFGLFFLVLLARLAWLQAGPSQNSALALKDDKFERRTLLPARRGAILAADGTTLAVTLDEYAVAVNPRVWSAAQKDNVAQILGKTIGNGAEDAAKFRVLMDKTTKSDGTKNFYVRLAKHIPEEKIEALREIIGPPKKAKMGEKQRVETRQQRSDRKKKWEPLVLEASPRRAYPQGDLAPQLLGFTTPSGLGVDGLEKAINDDLAGQPGVIDSLVDAQGRAVPGTIKKLREPADGKTVVTTIDAKIQAATDAEMKRILGKYHPNFCVAVVIKPTTGEIVAVSTAPSFDLNNRPKNISDIATNRAFSFAYEPGSTWKIITASAAVETIPDWQDKRFTITGQESLGKHTLHDWQFWSGKAKTDVKGLSEGIRDSSNICMYHFARLMPPGTLFNYAQKFGIREDVGDPKHIGPCQIARELPGYGIHAGYLPANDPKNWGLAQLANFSFGQGMMITPLQLARIGGVIANDGVLMKPLLVKEIRDARGQVVSVAKPQVEKVSIRPETAQTVKKMLLRVVEEGTARKFIFVPGYRAAGKTGSAQKANGKLGYGGKYISSFVGFLPADKPRYVIAVMADEPKASHWGSETCGPAFTNIAQAAMVQMRLEEGAGAPAPDPTRMVKPKPVQK